MLLTSGVDECPLPRPKLCHFISMGRKDAKAANPQAAPTRSNARGGVILCL